LTGTIAVNVTQVIVSSKRLEVGASVSSLSAVAVRWECGKRAAFSKAALSPSFPPLHTAANSTGVQEYRWYEPTPDGTRKRHSLVVGTLEQYPNEAAAKRAVASLLVDTNAESPRFNLDPMTVQTLVEHYKEKELGEGSNETFATCEAYRGYFRKWILPRWGDYRVKDVKSVAVEQRLRSLTFSNGSKAKIRNIMHAVFNHAVRWEWHDRNPITQVRQSSKRMSIPAVRNLVEVVELLLHLEEPTRTALLVDVMTGFRVEERLAFKWSDIDFERFQIYVTRSISPQHVGECKTEASRKPVPLDARIADTLWNWRAMCANTLLKTGFLKVPIPMESSRIGREPWTAGIYSPR